MREIKFRAKLKNGSWDFQGLNTTLDIFETSFSPWEHDIKTLGQFTGLKDKNGKEIYEGDIVKIYPYGTLSEVAFKDGSFMIAIPSIVKRQWTTALLSSQYIEVIGNIHDNPELLKGDK